MRFTFLQTLSLFVLFTTFIVEQAKAYDLEESNIPVVKKLVRPSGTKFHSDESWRGRIAGFGVSKDQLNGLSTDMQTKMDWRASRYENFTRELPTGAGTYDALPNCVESQVIETEVIIDSEKLAWFDLLFYNYHDPAQTKRAGLWELPTAPFLEGDLYNPYRTGEGQQELARLFELRCLPTRFHFISKNGQKYLEYREGERAWDTDSD